MFRRPQAVAIRSTVGAVRGLAAVALGAAAVWAQQVESPAPAARVEERKPELFYLQNDSGGLVPVPGFRYRDFVDLLRLKEGVPGPAQPPAAVLDEILVRADLTATENGTCPATIVYAIRQARRGWVDVPLGADGLIFSRPPQHAGQGRLLVDVPPDGTGYRAWLESAPEAGQETRHTVTVEGRLRVDAAEARESIVLNLPTATATAVELRSSRADPEVFVQPPPAEQAVRAGEAGGSTVTLAGIGGTTSITVGERSAAGPGRSLAAEAFVESVVRIDGRDAVSQARIRLGGMVQANATVRIAPPPGARVRSVRPPAVLVARGGSEEAPRVDVTAVRGADGASVVELECHRPLDRVAGAKEAGPFELAGFQVDGIEPWRQWGRISLVVEGEWQAVWNDGLRRVDPPAAGRRPGLVAAFAYDAQPASLQVRVLPRRSRVVVEPEYRYDVSAERIAMLARLRVAASGAPATEIVVAVDPAWAIDDVGPVGVVDTAGVTLEAGRIRIPFSQPLVGDAVVEIRGGRAVQRDAEEIAWRLPTPGTGLVGPATVVVGADSDIELLPDNERIKGLVRQTAASLARPEADRVVLAYRLDAAQGEFAATRRYLPRRVDAVVAVQAVMDEAATVVTETIRLGVMHVPLEFLELAVPDAVVAGGTLEARQGEWVLDPVEVPEADAGGQPPGTRRLRAILPGQLLGNGEVVVRYSVPTPEVPAETTVTHDFPLVLPVGGLIARQTFAIDAPERLSVEVRGDTWRREVSPQPSATGARVWSTIRRQTVVPLALAARSRAASGGLSVEAAVLRTSVFADRREDVFTYGLSGAAERLRLTLPDGPVEISIDGSRVAAEAGPDGGVVVELPRGGPGRWLLEIRRRMPREGDWNRRAARFGLPTRVALEPPRFAADATVGRFYWDVESRPDEWLFGVPASWTSQQRWVWPGLLPDRVPVVSRAALVEWVRAAGPPDRPSRGPADPAPPGRRSVFAGVGEPAAAAAWLMPVWFLVLACSGPTLAVGMLCAGRGPLRRPRATLMLAACGVLAAAAAPDVAPVAAIAALPGLLLAVVGWALQRWSGAGRAAPRTRAVPAAASSLTRPAASGSLIISGSAAHGGSPSARERSTP